MEDSERRIQNRLYVIDEDAPANAHFCTEREMLGGGLEEKLQVFLTEHPDTVLVIIDTLQMVRNVKRDNTYANDYNDLSALKKIADKFGIALLVIHHLRKEPDDDVFNRISGTTAISGAVFLINPCSSLELCIQMGISFLFPFCFSFSSFPSYL